MLNSVQIAIYILIPINTGSCCLRENFVHFINKRYLTELLLGCLIYQERNQIDHFQSKKEYVLLRTILFFFSYLWVNHQSFIFHKSFFRINFINKLCLFSGIFVSSKLWKFCHLLTDIRNCFITKVNVDQILISLSMIIKVKQLKMKNYIKEFLLASR